MIKKILKRNRLIQYNIDIHNKIADKYDQRHDEIRNYTEQIRINDMINFSLSFLNTDSEKKIFMDYGCGTGNLIQYLIESKAKVIAADVSQNILEVLKNKFVNQDLIKYFLLNGFDLSEFNDDSIDYLATYSVLHHVPDYLRIIKEFIRVIKPGGVLLIDHEVNPGYWKYNATYNDYLADLGNNHLRYHLAEIGISDKSNKVVKVFNHFKNGLKRKFYPELMPEFLHEGDIHTNLYDHIEWDRIKNVIIKSCDIIAEKDYLACKELGKKPIVWDRWKNKTNDMRYLLARKR